MPHNLSQRAIKLQLLKFLKITQENVDDHLLFLENTGYCYGFSLCRAAMRYVGKLDWWEGVLAAIAAWDGEADSLKQEILLPNADNHKLVTLQTIFERAFHYIVFNHASKTKYPHADIDQYHFLHPHGDFQLLKDDEELSVTDCYTAAGHFSHDDLVKLFQDDVTRHAIQNNMCLISKMTHACELSYDGHQWSFFNPNYPDGKSKSFEDVHELVHEIKQILGEDIAVKLIYLGNKTSQNEIAVDPFPYYNELLFEDPEKLISGNGLHIISLFPHLIPELFANLDRTKKMACLELNATDPRGMTPLVNAIIRGHIAAVMALVEAGADLHQPVEGWIPLKFAIYHRYIEIVDFILEKMNLDLPGLTSLRRRAEAANRTDITDLLDQRLHPLSQGFTFFNTVKSPAETTSPQVTQSPVLS